MYIFWFYYNLMEIKFVYYEVIHRKNHVFPISTLIVEKEFKNEYCPEICEFVRLFIMLCCGLNC